MMAVIIFFALCLLIYILWSWRHSHRLTQKSAILQQQAEQGALSPTFVHDLNNLLGCINTASEYIRTQLPSDSELIRYADLIISSGRRASRLSERILHPTLFNKQNIDAQQELEEAVTILKFRLRKDISVSVDNASLHHTVFCSPDSICNIVVNLVLNAQKAMPKGGRINIGVNNVQLPSTLEPTMLICPAAGNYLHLSIRDCGNGISAAALPHIFKPFFTTGELKNSTGLGLYSVYQSIEANCGGLALETSPKGTVFHVYLPLVDMKPQLIAPETKMNGHFLLVDDDAILSSVLQSILEQGGAKVTLCHDSASVIDLLSLSSSEFDAIMLDVLMPPPDGISLYHKLRHQFPKLKIIFMSGNHPDDSLQNLLSSDNYTAFLHKPYQISDVLDKVQALLGKN